MVIQTTAQLRAALRHGFTEPVLQQLFVQLPSPKWDDKTVRAFEQAYRATKQGEVVQLDPSLHKHEFLRYLVAHHPVLLHGSNHADIDELTPRSQTDFDDNPVNAVFATGDGVWPMFFAIVDQKTFRGSMRNGCFVVDTDAEPQRYYFFSVYKEWLAQNAWCDGTIYVLPKATFRKSDTNGIRFDEWISEVPVQPLMKLPIAPTDFPFLSRVAGHNERESILVSWLRYKKRVK
ncbi:MAG: hypothetical protein HC853_13195 [Anaerolineae bacterium]|nr:hypothetical protein [Anaerolineae bacterium]